MPVNNLVTRDDKKQWFKVQALHIKSLAETTKVAVFGQSAGSGNPRSLIDSTEYQSLVASPEGGRRKFRHASPD